MTELCFQR